VQRYDAQGIEGPDQALHKVMRWRCAEVALSLAVKIVLDPAHLPPSKEDGCP